MCAPMRNTMKCLTVALIQLNVQFEKAANIARAAEKIQEAKKNNNEVRLIALPECFNSPYGLTHFEPNAEKIPEGPTSEMLSQQARCNQVFLIGGTIPEIDGKYIYNTCTVWNPEGELIARYRKIHLFDIDIPGKIKFTESEVLSPGCELVTFKIDSLKIGLGICYDLRFNELAYLYRQKGCDLIVYPASFNMTTGPLHWELLQRARAVDNQLFIFCISPARGTKGYIAWGHTQCTNPWGSFKTLKEKEDILYETLNFDDCKNMREAIPVMKQRRCDIYETVMKMSREG